METTKNYFFKEEEMEKYVSTSLLEKMNRPEMSVDDVKKLYEKQIGNIEEVISCEKKAKRRLTNRKKLTDSEMELVIELQSEIDALSKHLKSLRKEKTEGIKEKNVPVSYQWVIKTIQEYGNVLIPHRMIKEHSLPEIIATINDITGYNDLEYKIVKSETMDGNNKWFTFKDCLKSKKPNIKFDMILEAKDFGLVNKKKRLDEIDPRKRLYAEGPHGQLGMIFD